MRAEDLDLVRREPHLPGMALLIDPRRFAERLSRDLPGLTSIQGPTYLRHKPGTSCIAAFEVAGDGEATPLYAKAFRPADRAKRLKAMRRAGGPSQQLLDWDEAEIVVCAFPIDLELATLAALHAPPERDTLLRKVLGSAAAGLRGRLVPLHHRPERRFVGRLEGVERDAAIKLHTAARFVSAKPAAKAFASRDQLLVPRMLGRSHRHGVVVSEWIVGGPLGALQLDPGAAFDACRTIGAALAVLHAQVPAKLRPRDRTEIGRRVLAVLAYLRELLPARAARLESVGRRLADTAFGLPAASSGIHGDFHPGQVLLRGDVVAILDLDDAVVGNPADDLGNFIAHLERAASKPSGPTSLPDPTMAREALLTGYGAAGVALQVDLATAAALFLLAPHPFRAREPDWPDRIEDLLLRVDALLSRAAGGRAGIGRGATGGAR